MNLLEHLSERANIIASPTTRQRVLLDPQQSLKQIDPQQSLKQISCIVYSCHYCKSVEDFALITMVVKQSYFHRPQTCTFDSLPREQSNWCHGLCCQTERSQSSGLDQITALC